MESSKLGMDFKLSADHRQRPEPLDIFPTHPLLALDPHQEMAIQAGIENARGIIQYPTGTGKGRILGDTARRLNAFTLILCDRKDLLHKLVEDVKAATGVMPGVIGDGQWNPSAVTVATFQAITRKLHPPEKWAAQNPDRARLDKQDALLFLKTIDAVLVDECHHITSDSMEELMVAMPAAYYRLGYSATPFKDGQKGPLLRVQGWLGPAIEKMSKSAGIETGRTVPTITDRDKVRLSPEVRTFPY